MSKEKLYLNKKKWRKVKNSKSGYTLVELCIVLLLLGILTTMIVTFSSLISTYSKDSRAEHEFFEDCADIKAKITELAAENDLSEASFSINDGKLSISDKAFAFFEGSLKLGEDICLENLNSIYEIKFSGNGKIIKCEIKGGTEEKPRESSFVFSLRVAEVPNTQEEQNG